MIFFQAGRLPMLPIPLPAPLMETH